jgi:hypothetical protein
MVFVIPRKKVLLSWNFLCLEIGSERNSAKKVFLKVVRVFFFVLEWFGTSFQKFFLSLNGFGTKLCMFSFLRMGTEFGAFLSSPKWFGTKLRGSECFSLQRNA